MYSALQSVVPSHDFSEVNKNYCMYIAEVDEMPKLHQLQRLSRDSTVINVIEAVAPLWEEFALYLKMERNMIDIWKRDTIQVKDATRKLFGHWLDGNGHQPISWRTLIQALHEAGLSITATDLEKILTGHSGESSQHRILAAPDIMKKNTHMIIHNECVCISVVPNALYVCMLYRPVFDIKLITCSVLNSFGHVCPPVLR